MKMEKKIPLNFFLLLFFPSLSRDVGFYNSRYKIVALKMHETTFNHPERMNRFVFCLPSSLQQK
jgi:hypothetical protein